MTPECGQLGDRDAQSDSSTVGKPTPGVKALIGSSRVPSSVEFRREADQFDVVAAEPSLLDRQCASQATLGFLVRDRGRGA
jgi:hypothetical protein